MELSNPVIDDDFIIGSPQKRYQKKKYFDNVQIMAGFTTHESSLDVFLRLGNASQVSKEEFKNVTGILSGADLGGGCRGCSPPPG